MSISVPRERWMMSTASSITSRFRRPRKSIFSRPISSIGPIEYWVTILYERSARPFTLPFPFPPAPLRSSASWSGTISSSGRSAITTAAAWMELLRTMPSRPFAMSTILLAFGSDSTAWRSSSPGFRQSSKLGLRPMIGSGISFARRSPVA